MSTDTGLAATATRVDKVYQIGGAYSDAFRHIKDDFICHDPALAQCNFLVYDRGFNSAFIQLVLGALPGIAKTSDRPLLQSHNTDSDKRR